jgi:CpeT protein
MMQHASFVAVLLFQFISVQAQITSEVKEFSKLIPGFYSTEAMWKKDSTFSNVQLHIVPIWQESKEEFWFYLEQAEVKSLQRPYRQAILHVTASNRSVMSANLAIKNRLSFAGAWKDAALLQRLTKADIDSVNTCNIVFTRISKKTFVGGTTQGGCPNQYKGASYFTNESALTEKSLTSWDRGWKADGQLAWGPAEHGYTFDKISGL